MTEGNGVGPAGVLTPLRRNRFFYGKLMDTRHWELEQEYAIASRRLVNRLGLGAGILCGLGVSIGADGSVCVAPGVAVDGRGREIVVGETVVLDRVDQLEDACGKAIGDPIRNGYVTIWLCYRECGSEYTRVADGDCGRRDECVPGVLDERFHVRVGTDLPATPPGLSTDACASIFQAPPGGPPRRRVVEELLAGPCTEAADSCVALATIQLDGAGTAIAAGVDYRTPLYSNEELFDLLMCLAARVDGCCQAPPKQLAPRVMDVWPPLAGEVPEDRLQAFMQERRLEIVFEREMRDLALDQPDGWLGVWQVASDGAARLPLKRASGSFTHVAPAPTQDAVAYDVAIDAERNPEDVAFVVMMRSAPGGEIVAGDDGAALDAELAATGLTVDERERLWKLAPDRTLDPVAIREHLLLPASPALPSGDGIEGGDLHGVAARTKVVQVLAPPQLHWVWPAGAKRLHPFEEPTVEEARRFLARPLIQLNVSRAIAEAAQDQIDTWLHVYTTNRDGAIYGFDPVAAKFAGAENGLDDSVTITVELDPEIAQRFSAEVLVILRPGAAPAGAEPTGVGEPHDLLDADFNGTSLDKQTVITIFDGGRTDPIDNLDPRSTDAIGLYDGSPGGLVHYSFTVFGLRAG